VIDDFMVETRKREGEMEYRYGDEWRQVWTDTVELRYASGDSLVSRSFPLFRTHHGPITSIRDGKWTATALMWDPVPALKQSYLRTKQSGWEGFRKMMDIRRNSSNNTVYADSEGNIAYFHGNFIPRRSEDYDYTQPVDGSDPKTDWQGLHEVDESIYLLNPGSGWIQNCNSTPFTSAGDHSPDPADYPVYMAPEPENTRGIHAIALLNEAREVDLDGLIDLAYDPYLPTFEILLPRLIEAYDKRPRQELAGAIELLRSWDYRTGVDSRAMTIGPS
jgi:acyl-homoserine lactone acylase PvdQ